MVINTTDMNHIFLIYQNLRVVAMLVKHMEMQNQISFMFMVLIIMVVHEKCLLRDNRHNGENSLDRLSDFE